MRSTMGEIRHPAFYKGFACTEKHPVLFTQAPLRPETNREHMTQITFGLSNVPAMHVANQAMLSSYASARPTGIVLDPGDADQRRLCHTTCHVSFGHGWTRLE